jgi:hypothetical protein
MIIHTDWYQSGSREKLFQRPEKTIETPKTPFSLSITAIPVESIPFIGVAVLIADTGYELYAACETVRDLEQLYVDLGMADESEEDAMHYVCDSGLPEAGEFWGGCSSTLPFKPQHNPLITT